MRFRVVVPERSAAGDTLRIHISDGTEANVKIPEGLGPGDSFDFEVPTHLMQNPKAVLQQQQQQQQPLSKSPRRQQQRRNQQTESRTQTSSSSSSSSAAHPIAEIETRQSSSYRNAESSSSRGLVRTTASLVDGANHNSSKTNRVKSQKNSSSSRTGGGAAALISSSTPSASIDFNDFFVSVLIGFLVGVAIIGGFVLGILHATYDIYSIHPIEKPKSMVLDFSTPIAGANNEGCWYYSSKSLSSPVGMDGAPSSLTTTAATTQTTATTTGIESCAQQIEEEEEQCDPRSCVPTSPEIC
mmetsp:Transcript_26845/g.55522  ORF Transcript_26845/g.55522 Transcript_26845/m.55522 type:complete len:299 (-) Transcript_26845:41-937(-)